MRSPVRFARTALTAVALALSATVAAGCLSSPSTRERSPMARTLQLADQRLELETVFEDDFSADTGQWLAEGGAAVIIRDGRMRFDAWDAKPQVETVWCRRAVDGDCVVEYTVCVDAGEGNTNLNFFLYATNSDGSSVLETTAARTGAYPEYHKIPNYIVTYLNSDENEKQDANIEDPSKLRVRVRFRKDPGFNLLCETWREPAIIKGRDYRFTIVALGDRTQLYVDGEPVFDYVETGPVLRRGHHGFRTWATRVSVDEFRISRIVSPESGGAKKEGR